MTTMLLEKLEELEKELQEFKELSEEIKNKQAVCLEEEREQQLN